MNIISIKSQTVTEVFFWICVQMGSIQEPIIWTVISCAIFSTINRQKRTEIAWMITVKKLINQSGSFESTAKFKGQPMELFENSFVVISLKAILNQIHPCLHLDR